MPRTYTNVWFRLALSLNGLNQGANFYILGIPVPDDTQFQENSVRRPSGIGGETRLGYSVLTWTWTTLLAESALAIREVIEAAEAIGGKGNGTVYFTSVRGDAKSGEVLWIDGHGIARMPEWTSGEGALGRSYANVQFIINNVTIDRQPSNINI